MKNKILLVIISILSLIFISFILLFLNVNKDYFINKIFKIQKFKQRPLDKAFVINLDQTPARWERTKSVLLQSGLKASQIERFSAIDGTKVGIYDYKNKKFFTGQDLKDKKVQFEYGNTYKINCTNDFYYDYTFKVDDFFDWDVPLAAGYLGINCSHLKILDEAKKRKYNNILVFEDDILLIDRNTNLPSEIKKMQSLLPYNFEMAILGNQLFNIQNAFHNSILKKLQKKLKIAPKNDFINNFTDFYNMFFGSFALYFSKNGIENFLKKSKRYNNLVSDHLYSKISYENKKTFFLEKPIFFQTFKESLTEGVSFNFFTKIFIVNFSNNTKNIKKIENLIKESNGAKNSYQIINYKEDNIYVKYKNKTYPLLFLIDNSFSFTKNAQYRIECSKNTGFDYINHTTRDNNFYIKNIKNMCAILNIVEQALRTDKRIKNKSIITLIDGNKDFSNFNIDSFLNELFLYFMMPDFTPKEKLKNFFLTSDTNVLYDKNLFINFKTEKDVFEMMNDSYLYSFIIIHELFSIENSIKQNKH